MKKRYMLTLTEENVETFRTLTRGIGMPTSTLSNAVDDFIHDLNQVIGKAKAKGSFTVKDIFLLMGEQIELLQEEEKHDQERKKEKTE